MKILNFGSLNIDHVYSVSHFVRPGETLQSLKYQKFLGGKGLNQSVALARAGARVFHAGKIGEDGSALKDFLKNEGVDESCVQTSEGASGHAIIQVNAEGENCIILHGGANQKIIATDVTNTLANFSKGDFLLLQNEISEIPEIIRQAHQKGMKIVFNPAPMNKAVKKYPLEFVDWLIVNRVEAADFSDAQDQDQMISVLAEKFPHSQFVLTLGKEGSVYFGKGRTSIFVPAKKVKVVDTTGAGDTFIGYFLAFLLEGWEVKRCLELASRASAICVTRPGGASSIPKREEVWHEK